MMWSKVRWASWTWRPFCPPFLIGKTPAFMTSEFQRAEQLLIKGQASMNPLSVQFSSVLSNSLQPLGLKNSRLPCPSPTLGVCSNSCPSSQWYHPIISFCAIPFSSCLQSFQASKSFPMSQFFASGDQSIGVSASAAILPMNILDWFPLGWTGLISVQSKTLSRVFLNTTV